MNPRLPGWQRVLLVVWLVAGSACAGQRFQLATGPAQTLNKAELLNFPESYRMVHRVRLSVRGRSMDFIGYLAVNGACLRAVALMEIGGEMFDLLACAGKMSVLKNPGRVPLAPLKRGILRELTCIFAPAPYASAAPGAGGDENERITIKVKSPAPGAGKGNTNQDLVELQLFQNDRLFSQVEISSFRIVDGWPHPVPDRFTLKNMHWGYELKVELLRMDMRPIAKLVFSER
jgi:hypothetical protein